MEHSYKLTYFNFTAVGEPIRWIFKYAQVPFEDVRIGAAEWQAKQKWLQEVALGQMPILDMDGKMMTQSLAIARFLCNKFGLVSDKALLNYKSDEVVHIVEDLKLQCRPCVVKLFQNPRPAELDIELKNLEVTVFPRFLKLLERIVGETKGPYIAGEEVTVGDFVLVNWLDIYTTKGFLKRAALDKYPKLKALKNALMSTPQIKEWVDVRPETII